MRKLMTFIVLAIVGLSFLTAAPALAGNKHPGNKHHKAAHVAHKHQHHHKHLKHHHK